MKKILVIFLTLLVICATFSGCGKTEASSGSKTPDYNQELLDLGFINPEEMSFSTDEIPVWQVELPNNYLIYVSRTIEGSWSYNPYLESDLAAISEICAHHNALELVGFVDNDKTPTFRIHVDNVAFYGYRDWNLVEEDRWGGGGIYDFHKVSDDKWDTRMSITEWSCEGYIPNVSLDTIKQLAVKYFDSNPYGTHYDYNPVDEAVLSCVWNYEKGELIE